MAAFDIGDIVEMLSLKRIEWNGQRAEIIGKKRKKSDGSSRWPVRILENDKEALIKQQNLKFLMHAFTNVPHNMVGTQHMSTLILNINDVVKATNANPTPFDVDKYQMAMRALPPPNTYMVIFQKDYPVLAIIAPIGNVKVEFLNYDLKSGGMALVHGWLKDGFDNHFRGKGIEVPWL